MSEQNGSPERSQGKPQSKRPAYAKGANANSRGGYAGGRSGTSGGPRSGTSGAPRSGTSGAPRSGTSGAPRSGTSGAPRSGTAGVPRSGTSGAARPHTDGDRSSRPDRNSSTPPPPPSQRPKVTVPEIPEDITASMLDKQARARLRTLSKDNAEDVGRHLVMAGELLDEDPELAYGYAQVALARGGRVDIVREAAAVTAYATGRYAEALREFRTVRRLNGSSEHIPLMADCERGLGRPARALAIAAEPEVAHLSPHAKAELGMVVAGARADLGDVEAAHLTLTTIRPTTPEQQLRITKSRADLLERMGRSDEAAALRASLPPTPVIDEPDEDIVVYDLAEDEQMPLGSGSTDPTSPDAPSVGPRNAQAANS